MIHPLSIRLRVSAGSHSSEVQKACGHRDHVGTCPQCQRAQLARWRAQLNEAQPVARR
jgi:hypothetical protein